MNDPSSKTKKGKKVIAKTFKELEKAVLEKLGGDVDEEGSEAVSGAIENIQETLKMDSIADDYTKRLKALADSEKRILRFIKAQGLESMRNAELEGKLGDGGLDVSGWHRLLARSSTESFGWDIEESSHETANAVGKLAVLLGTLETNVGSLDKKKVTKTPEKLAGDLLDVRHEMSARVAETDEKIKGLVDAVSADKDLVEEMERMAEKTGRPPKVTRKRLLMVLAEVVQEICQPLSVIDCSLGMVTEKTLGEITSTQEDMLKLALESSGKIKTLVDHLEELAGLPSYMNPDKQIQDSLYGRS